MALSTAEWLEREAEKEVSRLRDIPYRTGEVAVLFGLDPRTIRKYVELGDIPGFLNLVSQVRILPRPL